LTLVAFWNAFSFSLSHSLSASLILEHPGYYDEFYHALAAGSMLPDSSQAGHAFTYGRASQFTWMVSVFFQLFGESLVAARLPSVLAGSRSVAVLFLMVRSVAGPVAGRVSALLLCFDPHALFFSQMARFYALHSLTFLLGSLAVYQTMRGPLRSQVTMAYVLAAALLLVFSARLTPVTSVGV
jgi:4-amino-4-deoxy-L-arabinose transferase-like glycosyltransferase